MRSAIALCVGTLTGRAKVPIGRNSPSSREIGRINRSRLRHPAPSLARESVKVGAAGVLRPPASDRESPNSLWGQAVGSCAMLAAIQSERKAHVAVREGTGF